MTSEREHKRTPNPDAAGWPNDEFSADLGHGHELVDVADATEESEPLSHHEAARLRGRIGDAVDGLTVLLPGTRLQQGSTYVDLERLDDGPFVALAGQSAEKGQLLVSKRNVDHETWNSIVGRDAERDRAAP